MRPKADHFDVALDAVAHDAGVRDEATAEQRWRTEALGL